MKSSKASNVISYVLGMGFNLAIMAVVVYAIIHFTQVGFNLGETFASEMLAEGPDYEIEFILEEDTPRAEVAEMLEHLGIISNRWWFQLEMFLKNSTRVYRAGTYTLNRNMTNTDVNATLRRPPAPTAPEHHVVTIREGWTIRDMAQYFEEVWEFFPREEFIEYAQTGVFNFAFLNDVPDLYGRNRLEGYLFPDTYWFPIDPTPRDIISRMLRQFENTMDAQWYSRAYEMGLTLDEVIIIASIIEAETRLAEERPMVSQVIQNRLDRGMRLQMCSTVDYILNVGRIRLTNADTQIHHPYNTYTNDGLPIGPIGNPGRASIEAALWPEPNDYLFFVLEDPATGRHFFSTNFSDHQAAGDRLDQVIRQWDQ